MSLEAKIGIVAIVATIVVALGAAWLTKKHGTQRRRLLFLFEATALVHSSAAGAASALKVTYQDLPVEDPHLLTLRLENIGPVDVASAHFDSNKPVRLALNSTIYGILSNTHPEHTVAPAIGTNDAVIELKPLLLKRKDAWVIEVVVSGSPDPKLISSLIDTDVVSQTTGDRIIVATSTALDGVLSVTVPATAGPVAAELVRMALKRVRRK